MDSYILVGSGGMAAEVRSYLNDIYRVKGENFKFAGYLDSSDSVFLENSSKYKINDPYLGDPFSFDYTPEHYYVCCVGSPAFRNRFLDFLEGRICMFPNIYHPTAIIADDATFGYANIVSPFCVFGPNVKVGSLNVFTSYSFVSHDCDLGSANFFSTAGLAGAAKVGNSNFFGIRSTILPGVKVGNFNTVQAGMHLDKDIGSDETVFYKFKEKLQIIRKG